MGHHHHHGWGGKQEWGSWGHGSPWTPGGPAGRPPGPPPWVQDLVRSFGGPDLASRGQRARRGDVRSAILAVLSTGPMNGYQVIGQIQERSGGGWRPSPGSVYPTIQQLEDEGLVVGQEQDGRRALRLTDEGERYVVEHADELEAVWEPFEEARGAHSPAAGISNLKSAMGQMMSALWQVMTSGTDQQRAEAIEILDDTRRRLYGLLADGDDR